MLEGSCLVDARRDGGIGRYARQLSQALECAPDVQVTIATPSRPPLSEARPSRFLHAQPPLLSTTRTVRPHLVHGLGGEPVVGWPAARQVVTVHDVEMWRTAGPDGLRGAALRAYAAAVGRMLRRCAAIIAVSEITAAEAADTLRLEPRRVHVVPHGVTPEFHDRRRPSDAGVLEAAGLSRGPYLLWVGSLRHHDPRKGLDILLDAVAQLPPPVPTVALAGATGREAERLASRARDLGIRMVLCGRRGDTDLAALYRGAAVVTLPSTHEGFGFPVLEAMACGSPVVATTAGNIPAVAGEAAILVQPGDAGALSDALRSALTGPEPAARLRKLAGSRAESFTWERCAARTAEVYRQVMAGR
ncbi:MAG: glycosyltransferase family 4 protein [Candidatus Dormibacteria bacterium]